jgi:hypothetical protein
MKGDTIDLTEPVAEAVNRDSPGILKPVKGATIGSGSDRMVKTAETRQGELEIEEEKGRGHEEPITKETFKAVKG